MPLQPATPSPRPAPDPSEIGGATLQSEPSTLRLNKGDATLFQTLGDAPQRHHCLIAYSGEHMGRRYSLEGEHTVIGRSTECDVCIESAIISRRHAELHIEGDRVVLRDLGSSNGTLVNDVRLQAPAVLKDGDLIRLGTMMLKFYDRHSLGALLHDRIYRMATVDDGTETYTKKYLLETLEREMQRARRSGRPLAVLGLDLDHFKAVNDRYGHNAGDVVLRGAAAAAKGAVRANDIVGRIGGEEFAVVLPETDLRSALDLAERIRRAVADLNFALELHDPQGGRRTVSHRQTVSLGAAQLGPAMISTRDLLGAADAMLYTAKRDGRNCVRG
jgi:two-component system, cell cycle response regulator